MNNGLAIKLKNPPKHKEWHHFNVGYMGGLLVIYEYEGEEVYSLPNLPAFVKLWEGVGKHLFSYKGVNTTTHYFKTKSREALFAALRLQGVHNIRKIMEFKT